jgi:hypothetical protein
MSCVTYFNPFVLTEFWHHPTYLVRLLVSASLPVLLDLMSSQTKSSHRQVLVLESKSCALTVQSSSGDSGL